MSEYLDMKKRNEEYARKANTDKIKLYWKQEYLDRKQEYLDRKQESGKDTREYYAPKEE